jgi:hypothetical protein
MVRDNYLKEEKMKREKYRKNKLTQKNNYNPFNELWFWLQLASIRTDFICSQDKHDEKQNYCIDTQNPNSTYL